MAEHNMTGQLTRDLHDTRETIDQVRRMLDDLIAAGRSPAIDTLTVSPGVHTALAKLAAQATYLNDILRQHHADQAESRS